MGGNCLYFDQRFIVVTCFYWKSPSPIDFFTQSWKYWNRVLSSINARCTVDRGLFSYKEIPGKPSNASLARSKWLLYLPWGRWSFYSPFINRFKNRVNCCTVTKRGVRYEKHIPTQKISQKHIVRPHTATLRLAMAPCWCPFWLRLIWSRVF